NEFFGVKKKDTANLSVLDHTYLKKYRALDEHGKKIIDFILNTEYERLLKLKTDFWQREKKSAAEPREEAETVEMRVYWQPAAAGIGNYLTDDDSYDLLSFAVNEIPRQADFGVRISGDSMEPKIADGDIVWIKAAPQIENGEIGIFILDGNALCKKLHLDYERKKITLVSLNPNRADIEIHDDENLRTVGKVLLRKY
ncbi:MAG: S24 family peptidase, partial [Sporomusaceae bacterium]|nr:S24 family peptidase [Sporomusaceae bacterium]